MPGNSPRTASAPLRIRVAPEDVVLHIWGLRDLGWFGWLNLAIAAAASYGIGWLTGWPAAGGAVLAVLVLSLWRFWLPIRYELGSQGIAQTVLGRTIRVPWTAILNYRVRTGGVMLYSDAVLTPLAPLRALYLPWGRQKEQVLSQVDYYLSTWAQSECSGGRA